MKRSISSLGASFLSRLYTRTRVIVYEHVTAVGIQSPARIVRATRENLQDLSYFHSEEKLARFRSFLEEGDAGYLAYLDGTCVHRSWVVHTERYVPFHPLCWQRLKPGEVFIHYCETAPAARGKSVYPLVLAQIVKDYPGRPVLIAVDEKNAASQRGVVKAGFVPARLLRLKLFCGIRSVQWQTLPKTGNPLPTAEI